MIQRDCAHCGKTFSFHKSREKTAKACSRECWRILSIKPTNTKCANCDKPIRRKARSLRDHVHHFCGHECSGEFKKTYYAGKNNPNYKARNYDSDGYRVYVPPASLNLGLGRIKQHTAMALISMGVTKIPKGYHVHHRDCNVLNNDVENLALLTISDHVWLHKQFGNATLWAFMNGKISLDEIVSWSDNPKRASRLLLYDVWTQGSTRQMNESRVENSFDYCTNFEFIRPEIVEVLEF